MLYGRSARGIMKIKKIFFVIILFLSSIMLSGQQRVYSEQVAFISTLGVNFSTKILSYITYSSEKYPIFKITYNKNTINKKKYLVLCGVHGNEPAPVYAIKDFLLELNSNKVNTSNPQVDFLYIVNPWGFEKNNRYNINNIDVNRDFLTFTTQEAQVIKNNINLSEYECVFDFHEGNTKGYYLYFYSKKYEAIANNIIDLYKVNNVPIENDYIDVKLKTINGKIFVPWYAKMYMKHNKTITTTLWSYDNGIEKSFTIESSKNRSIDERKRIIKEILAYIVNSDF